MIALNDGEQHTVLRRFLWTEVVIPAQERLTQEQSDGGVYSASTTTTPTQVVVNDYIAEMIGSVQSLLLSNPSDGSGGDPNAANLAAMTTIVGDFVVRWAMKVMFDVFVEDDMLQTIRRLFLASDVAIFPFWAEPFASNMTYEEGQAIEESYKKVSSFLLSEAPVLRDYIPSEKSYNLSKKEYADLVVASLCSVQLLGVQQFLFSIFNVILPHYSNATDDAQLDPNDAHALASALLEALRLNAVVKTVNVILPSDTQINVGGTERSIPAGTTIAGSLALASWDETEFGDPFVYNASRPNLWSHSVGFGSAFGFDPSSLDVDINQMPPGRSCLGQNLVMKLGVDVLAASIKMEEAAIIEEEEERGDSLTSVECLSKFEALGFEADNFFLYDRYFKDDSKFIFPAAGVYKGVEGIEGTSNALPILTTMTMH